MQSSEVAAKTEGLEIPAIKPWLFYAIITTLAWGVWGGVMEFPGKWGFPETLGYVVWALTMVPCALIALAQNSWKLEWNPKAVFLGSMIGFLGAGGQLILFLALKAGPAYIIFPVISLYPVLTIALSVLILHEKVKRIGVFGIFFALLAIAALSYQPPSGQAVEGLSWLILAILVFIMWGLQAYVMKFANSLMQAESIFFYMMATAVLLSPLAILMTDFSKDINWGANGPLLSFAIQILNSIGALFLVYALRYGKAIVVVPMTSMAPVITILISLAIYGVVPNAIVACGMALATVSIYMLSFE